ncbi:MAG: SDR family oxidoreductase [Bacteroidales bacterium]|nr:SDR family oxidoreductase [Bacteroidales bacterium]
MKKILVTGAGGYVGVPLCEKLLAEGHKVIALDRYFFGINKVKSLKDNPDFEVFKEDIRYCDTAFLKDVDIVIDLAGLSNDASAEINPELTIDINHKGAMRIAKAAKDNGVKRYLYSSSASVYGNGKKTSLTEEDELYPQTQYAKCKVDVEKDLLKIADNSFEVVLFRNATIFGLAPRMRFDLAINIMTMRAWKNRLIYVMGGGKQWRPFVHVNDVVQAFILGLNAPAEKVAGEIFNVGSTSQNVQIKQLAQYVIDVIPNVAIHNIPDDPDTRTYNLNFDKIKNVLGYQPKTLIHEGIVEIKQALEKGIVDPDDPTCFTLQWYKSLMEWNIRLKELEYKGKIL